MAKQKKAKKKKRKQKKTWYVFGKRPDKVVEFIREVYAFSARQACAFVKKKHRELLSSPLDSVEYVRIWGRQKLPEAPKHKLTRQMFFPFF
ncbi:MAG: hypothetical protein K8Q91_00365 [Candidatus Vogelbacteria bacterium]|nr:hypothetical protein [Candidatus Vogelbacteria bacterium]